jgi:hypothetical protein
METPPPEKKLRMAQFTIHATRGLLRDERARRTIMLFSLLAAVVMLVAGLTVLQPWLNPKEHPWRFILYWFVCAWDTLLVLLLALLDMLLIRAQARAAQKAFRAEFGAPSSPDKHTSPNHE